MAIIVIRKKITLDFLGDEYKDDYLVFKALPLAEYEKLLSSLEDVTDDGKKSLQFIAKVLEDQYIEGKFQNEDVSKDDLKQFDLETLTRCFELFTGRTPDPKDLKT